MDIISIRDGLASRFPFRIVLSNALWQKMAYFPMSCLKIVVSVFDMTDTVIYFAVHGLNGGRPQLKIHYCHNSVLNQKNH